MVKKNDNNEKKIAALLEDLTLLEGYAQELFSFAPVPIFFCTPKGVILEANPALENITGKDAYELVGEPIESILDEKEARKMLEGTVKKGAVKDQETILIGKGGNKIPVSFFSKTRKTEKEGVTGCFFGFFDLTEIKKKENALKESSQVLEIKVKAKTRELRELAKSLEEKVKERTRELEEKLVEMEKTNKLMVGRELKMIDLKERLERSEEEIRGLKEENEKLKSLKPPSGDSANGREKQ